LKKEPLVLWTVVSLFFYTGFNEVALRVIFWLITIRRFRYLLSEGSQSDRIDGSTSNAFLTLLLTLAILETTFLREGVTLLLAKRIITRRFCWKTLQKWPFLHFLYLLRCRNVIFQSSSPNILWSMTFISQFFDNLTLLRSQTLIFSPINRFLQINYTLKLCDESIWY
jgi:hypothetical protein